MCACGPKTQDVGILDALERQSSAPAVRPPFRWRFADLQDCCHSGKIEACTGSEFIRLCVRLGIQQSFGLPRLYLIPWDQWGNTCTLDRQSDGTGMVSQSRIRSPRGLSLGRTLREFGHSRDSRWTRSRRFQTSMGRRAMSLHRYPSA